MSARPCPVQWAVRSVAADHRSDYHVCRFDAGHGGIHRCVQCDAKAIEA